MKRPAYIVIHGHGGTLSETLRLPERLNSFECLWEDGIFYLPKLIALPLRRLLSEGEDDNRLFTALRKIALSRMLLSSLTPAKSPGDSANWAEFRESSLIENFPSFSIPIGYESRKAASERLKQEGEQEFTELFTNRATSYENIDNVISALSKIAGKNGGVEKEENQVIEALEALFSKEDRPSLSSGNRDLVAQLTELRDMEETGGDLDTVASALFYAHYLISDAKRDGRTLKYGRDYRFVFINYHEGLRALGELPPGDIYMADMPISTIPDFENDLLFLKSKEIRMLRYEDHHPYTPEHYKMLEKLHNDGLLAYFAMSGPMIDNAKKTENDPEELKCGADMVYEALIEGREWDNPAMQHLREITHHEDFASERRPTGKILTELIKGGTSKMELVQNLLHCIKKEDILRSLNDKGWYEKVQRERYEAIEISDRFMENIYLLEIERPELSGNECSGPPLDDGSDMPIPLNRRNKESKKIHILLALAPKTKRQEPKLNIGRACEYFSEKIENLDYLFFCYGSSIIVGRRINQADTSINLSTLFKKLGTENDGGHSGASVCSPEKNKNYPARILGRVTAANFANFSRYISEQISKELNVEVIARNNISIKNKTSSLSSGGKKVIYLIISAVIIGLLVLLIYPEFNKI